MSASSEYAAEITRAYQYLNRIAKAHGQGVDHVLHDIALAHCEKPGFTKETFCGVYIPIPQNKGFRLTIPSNIKPAPAFNVYLTTWGDIVYSPLTPQAQSKRMSEIIVGS